MPGGVDFPHGYISINSGTNECILGVGAVGSSGGVGLMMLFITEQNESQEEPV